MTHLRLALIGLLVGAASLTATTGALADSPVSGVPTCSSTGTYTEQAQAPLVLYLDAGSSDGLKATRAADYLREAGISDAQGFFLNSTHFDWDTTEIQQGQLISKLLGGTHFVISSGVNGRGPLLLKEAGGSVGPRDEHEAGNSAGACRAGAPPSPDFWPAYAVSLYRNRQFGITGPRLPLKRDGTYAP